MQRAKTAFPPLFFFFFLYITFFFFTLFSVLFCMHFSLKVCLVKRIKGGEVGGSLCVPYFIPSPFTFPPLLLLYSEEEQETAVHVLRRNEHETYRIQTREFSQPISGDKSPCHLHTTLEGGCKCSYPFPPPLCEC